MIPTHKVPWARPLSLQEQELSLATSHTGAIVFQLELASWTEIINPIYVYKCYSCYSASGDHRRCFETTPEYPEDLKNGPTQNQIDEMEDHAMQHTIMYQWARRVE